MADVEASRDWGELVDLCRGAWRDRHSATLLLHLLEDAEPILQLWAAWEAAPCGCEHLHLVAVVHAPTLPASFFTPAVPSTLPPQATRLSRCERDAGHGWRRFIFAAVGGGEMILTLVVGDTFSRRQPWAIEADAIVLKRPSGHAEGSWAVAAQELSRLSLPRRTQLLAQQLPAGLTRALEAAGFVFSATGSPGTTTAQYAPQGLQGRVSRRRAAVERSRPAERSALVIGAGLAGTAASWALTRRGWAVTLIERASGPAMRASGLPIGLAIPHFTRDDAPVSQLTRSGVAWLRQVIAACNLPTSRWRELPVDEILREMVPPETDQRWRGIFSLQETSDGLPCRRFDRGLLVEGKALTQAMLAQAYGLKTLWNTRVANMRRCADDTWEVLDETGTVCAAAPTVIIAAGVDTRTFVDEGGDYLSAVRGQITLGEDVSPLHAEAPFVRTGNGHFIRALRPDAGWQWSMGATFDAGSENGLPTRTSDLDNFRHLEDLAPSVASALAVQFEGGQTQAFVELRCASPDHLPIVGPWPDLAALAHKDAHLMADVDCPVLPGLHVLSAMGARGLSLGPLGAELLASQLNGDPWPVSRALASSLAPARLALRARRREKTRHSPHDITKAQ